MNGRRSGERSACPPIRPGGNENRRPEARRNPAWRRLHVPCRRSRRALRSARAARRPFVTGKGAGMSRRHPVLSRSCAVLNLKEEKAYSPGTPCAPAVHHMLVHHGGKKSIKNCAGNRIKWRFCDEV